MTMRLLTVRSRRLVGLALSLSFITLKGSFLTRDDTDAKAKKDMMEAAKGKKGPLNTGQQGIKKSGKK